MASNSFSEWGGTGGTGMASNTFPMHAGPEPWFKDRLDALRSARIPSADYPDGYLETVRTRRQDRLVAHGGGQASPSEARRSYERGVHVGSRVSPHAYFWSEELHPQLGLQLQARGQKFAPQGELIPQLTNSGKPVGTEPDAVRQAAWVPRARSV